MGSVYSYRNLDFYSMRRADVNTTFKVTGLQELSKKLDSLLLTDPTMEKQIKHIIGKALKHMQTLMSKKAADAMLSDPRNAAKAVRYTVYRRILGGNVNILRRKKASGKSSGYVPERHPSSGRGGNRMQRTERTIRMDGYEGVDRGFILRFLESGARKDGGRRQIRYFTYDDHRAMIKRGSQGGNISKYGNISTINTGNRGNVTARHWFGSQAGGMSDVAEGIEREIDHLIAETFANV